METTVVDDAVFSRGGWCADSYPKLEGRFNILFLTHIEQAKGIYEAIATYEILRKKYPYLMLTVAGDGSELKAVREIVQQKAIPYVQFLGYVEGEAKHEAYETADVCFFTSYTVGMPTTVLEAMAYGVPVVTHEVGGIPDFFESGKMGFMTPSLDPAVLALEVEKLIGKGALCASIGAFNTSYAREHFVASRVCRRLESIYQGVLDSHSE